jgi:FtsP/CotA-like multicopper oxidase with cupredoxin domain
MADGRELYVFGFSDVTGPPADAQNIDGQLRANQPAPTIEVKEGQRLHLSLSIAGFALRPDIPDPHTVHYHGFPNASAMFDGVPDLSIAPTDGATLHYYYENVHPGTYIWHCHVEATEHLQMGMIGQLYVTPAQDGTTLVDASNGQSYTRFAYNDGNASTGYDVAKAIQLTDFDVAFHDASLGVQPLPFANMDHTYFLMNGRGYPDTVDPNPLINSEGNPSQPLDALIEVNQGERILIRLSNLSITLFHTIEALGLPMRVVGEDARLLRGPTGQDLSYLTNSVTIGGGQTVDVLIDTAGMAPGTYFLFSRNLFTLNNNEERRGGMMAEIRVN